MEHFLSYISSRDLAWYMDKMAGTIEFIILYPFFMVISHIIKVKTSVSLNIKSQFMWFMYCVWGVVYFCVLHQYFAMFSSIIWCLCYFVKIYVVFKYRAKEMIKT